MPHPRDIPQWLSGDDVALSSGRTDCSRNQRLSGRIIAIGDFLDAAGWCVVAGIPGKLWISERAYASLTGNADTCRTWSTFLKMAPTIPGMEVLDRQARIAIWKPVTKPTPPSTPPALTPRESEILQLLVAGKTSAEIAIILACKPRTVETHVSSLYRKIGVRNRSSLILSSQPSAADETSST
jgi:DNA-binding CsgD family transcriptional regulator